MYIYIYIYIMYNYLIVAIFYPFSQFCEMDISLLSLQKQANTAPNLFQRGVEYGKYVLCLGVEVENRSAQRHTASPASRRATRSLLD